MMEISDIEREFSTLETRRGQWAPLWSECARLVLPHGDDFYRSHSPGSSERTRTQYDSFGMRALFNGASALNAGLTPRTAMWHKLTTRREDLDHRRPVARYLEELNTRLFRMRTRPGANFAGTVHETYISIMAFGTGVFMVEEDPRGGARYRSIHLSEAYLAEDEYGFTNTFFRPFQLTAQNAVRKFSRPDDTLPTAVKDKAEKAPHELVDFMHVIRPNEEYRRGAPGWKGMRFTDFYTCREPREVVRRDGFFEFPVMAPRWVKASNEIYGRSPVIMLLPDLKMLNEMRRTWIEVANLQADPPIAVAGKVDASFPGMVPEFDMVPGARNVGFVNQDGRQLAIPIDTGGNFPLTLELLSDLRDGIDDTMLGRYFRALVENPDMTATHALLLAQEQGQRMAPTMGRGQAELLDPLIRRESAILHRQGRMPDDMPRDLRDFHAEEGEPLDIEFDSPMTRVADQEQALGVMRTTEGLAGLAEIMGPEIFHKYNPDAIAETVARANGMPAKTLLSDEEVEAKRQQQQAERAMGAALEAAPVLAETAERNARAQALQGNVPAPVVSQ